MERYIDVKDQAQNSDKFQVLYKIEIKLKLMHDLTDSQYKEAQLLSFFPNWHLLGIYPLLIDGEKQLQYICTKYYNYAQDMIMFSIYNYDCKKFYPTFKFIMLSWHKNNMEMNCNNNVTVFQLCIIDNKYMKNNINILKDQELYDIFYNKYDDATYLCDMILKNRSISNSDHIIISHIVIEI